MSSTKSHHIFGKALQDPVALGLPPPKYRMEVEGGMTIERDVAIPLRTGRNVFADIFRPEDAEIKVAPLIAWTPYGKHGGLMLNQLFPDCGVKDSWISRFTPFEAPDPVYWTKRGYAVVTIDIPGSWTGEGRVTYADGTIEAEAFYDSIEYIAKLPWSNGKVGLSGVSYLAVMQWHVAALNPPSLAAIHPNEGWTDFYREVAQHGGIPCTGFFSYLCDRWNVSINEVEQIKQEAKKHPLFDKVWETKRAKLDRIKVPALVTASYTDQGLHTRGTFEGFKQIRSQDKWLIAHRKKKWEFYYTPEIVERQRRFFDKYLLGKNETGIENWPRVLMQVPTGLNQAEWREEKEWPLKRQILTPFYLDAASHSLQLTPRTTRGDAGYQSMGSHPTHIRQAFDVKFREKTEITGHISAKLFMETSAGTDMDVFVAIYKLDREGKFVPQTIWAVFEDGPVCLGWLRASHRELDTKASKPEQPVLLHKRLLPIKPGNIIEMNIELLTSSMTYLPDETLRFVVQGTDIYRVRWKEESPDLVTKHEADQSNQGYHTIHTGGDYMSQILLPLIPTS